MALMSDLLNRSRTLLLDIPSLGIRCQTVIAKGIVPFRSFSEFFQLVADLGALF